MPAPTGYLSFADSTASPIFVTQLKFRLGVDLLSVQRSGDRVIRPFVMNASLHFSPGCFAAEHFFLVNRRDVNGQ